VRAAQLAFKVAAVQMFARQPPMQMFARLRLMPALAPA